MTTEDIGPDASDATMRLVNAIRKQRGRLTAPELAALLKVSLDKINGLRRSYHLIIPSTRPVKLPLEHRKEAHKLATAHLKREIEEAKRCR